MSATWCVCNLGQLSGADLATCKAAGTPSSDGWCFVDSDSQCQAAVNRPNAIRFHPAIPAADPQGFAMGCVGVDIGDVF